MPRAGSTTDRVARPIAGARGSVAFVGAWVALALLAHLTGATSILIVLAASTVALSMSAFSGLVRLRTTTVAGLRLPVIVTAGEQFTCTASVSGASVWVQLLIDGQVVAKGWSSAGRWSGSGECRHRGVYSAVQVAVRSGGSAGLVWWQRRFALDIAELVVAPAPIDGHVQVDTVAGPITDAAQRTRLSIAGDLDGVRQWRDGDDERWIHWPSTLRAHSLIVHDRRQPEGGGRVVRAAPDAADPCAEAARVRHALQALLRTGTPAAVALGAGPPTAIGDEDAAARWTARFPTQAAQPPARRRRRARREPVTQLTVAARWWTAAAVAIAQAMLAGATGIAATMTVALVVAVAAGAAVSARAIRHEAQLPRWVRVLVAAGGTVSVAVLARHLVTIGAGATALLDALRGPMPQLLVVVIALHGFECIDRRSARVALAAGGVGAGYASGMRVDGHVGLWLVAWWLVTVIAAHRIAAPPPTSRRGRAPRRAAAGSARRVLRRSLCVAGAALATMAVLTVVPIPHGPARLMQPTSIAGASVLADPTGLALPDGTMLADGDGDGSRSTAGLLGGYPGFSYSLDTSIRGALDDQVVMRVRAGEPDYWRGQTFAEFDGRTWHVTDELLVEGIDGPLIDLDPAFGDVRRATEGETFVQTFYAEVEMPNLLFAAYQPERLVIDTTVWPQADGSLRSSVVLPRGSIYTVVSRRVRVTADRLRSQGDIASRLSPLGREAFVAYLEVPTSTTQRTIDLAGELAGGLANPSTYDLAMTYNQWFKEHVVYDLDAPVPAAGVDAVDDLLFGTQQGFCEQIATAFTIMLRSQGVPARLATGYLPGERDQISGVWKVRASDAHAWVEVWFPETGWQAFDPTSAVPLAGDSSAASIGADVLRGALSAVSGHRPQLAGALGAVALTYAGYRAAIVVRYRRRRGRWGVLQDRFDDLARRRRLGGDTTNAELGRRWVRGQPPSGDIASLVAALDSAGFDPTWTDNDANYVATRATLQRLGR